MKVYNDWMSLAKNFVLTYFLKVENEEWETISWHDSVLSGIPKWSRPEQ